MENDNKVVKALTEEHVKEVKKAWKSLGIDTKFTCFSSNEEGGGDFIYYGIINGIFSNYKIDYVEQSKAQIVTIKELLGLQFPREVIAWDFEEVHAEKVILLAEITIGTPDYKYICVDRRFVEQFNDNKEYCVEKYKNIKEISKEEPIKEYTVEELTKLVGHEFKIIK